MQLNYISLLLITYFGLPIGSLISSFTKEELKEGKRYFRIARPIIFSATFFFFMGHLAISLAISVLFSLIMMVLFYILASKKMPYSETLFYIFLGIALSESYDVRIAVLIFMFGIVTASLYHDSKISMYGNILSVLKRNLVYVITGLLMAFI